MYLGTILKILREEPPNKTLPFGFKNPHSYRGDYFALAFEPAENVKVEDMIKECEFALDRYFIGWKGGNFLMDIYSEVYLAEEGELGKPFNTDMLEKMLESDHYPRKIIFKKEWVSYSHKYISEIDEMYVEIFSKLTEEKMTIFDELKTQSFDLNKLEIPFIFTIKVERKDKSDKAFILELVNDFKEREKFEKITTLEKRAKNRYIDNIEWEYIIETLHEDEKEEYYQLQKELGLDK